MTDNTEEATPVFEVGSRFVLPVPASMAIEEAREWFRERFGFEPHFHAQVGPAAKGGDETEWSWPIVAIDDPYLQLKLKCPLPSQECYVLIGHVKARLN